MTPSDQWRWAVISCGLLASGGGLVAVLLFSRSPPPAEVLVSRPGDPCQRERDCRGPLSCINNRCVSFEDARVHREQQTYLAAKATALPAVGGDPGRLPYSVKVRRVSGEGPTAAQCAVDERLVGGGCSMISRKDTSYLNYPEGFGEQDTLGARWYCANGSRSDSVSAYALCMWVPPAP